MKHIKHAPLLLVCVLAIGGLHIHSGFSEEVTPVINELMSSNSTIIQDEDGDYPDWIELFNPGTSPIDMTGYGLSDRESEPFKWVFPPCILNPGEFKLIFASGPLSGTNVPCTSRMSVTSKSPLTGAVGMSLSGRVLMVAHTDRGDEVQIISARKATRKEQKYYEEGE